MIEKHIRKNYTGRLFRGVLIPAAVFAAATGAASSLYAQGQPGYQGGFNMTSPLQVPAMPSPAPITPNGAVVEDVIARVNDQIITRSEYVAAEQQMLKESQQQNISQADFVARQQDLLRDMIDQQILLSKGKEMNITGDAEMTRQLDDIRKKNHFASMEDLEKAATAQGVSFEDFKEGIKNTAVTQQVIREQVGRRINMTHAQEEAYYAAHSKDFEVPEQVHLSEILVATPDNATDAQVAEAQTKADALEAKLKGGASFAEVAKASSSGPTAAAGGDLGDFKRGTLGDVLEKATFPLAANSFTAPIRTRQGFVILRVDSHQAAGVPPLASVEPQVEEGVYLEALQPALRDFLTKARTELYIEVKPGFVDTGAIARKDTRTQFTAYQPPPVKKKVLEHQKAEQQRAATAQAELAAARAKVAARNAEKAAAQAAVQAAKNPNKQNVSKPVKAPKIHREKIRYGQAPRNTLPTAPLETSQVNNGALAGQAPGVAMALADSTTTISTGGEENADPLAPQVGPVHKTRFAAREQEEDTHRLQTKLAKDEVKTSVRPVAADAQTTANEKQQASALGLAGDTSKKKPKHVKGAPKERLQETAPKPAETTPAIAPTVNPALGATPAALQPTPAVTTPAPAPATTTPQ